MYPSRLPAHLYFTVSLDPYVYVDCLTSFCYLGERETGASLQVHVF
jgi:hypothetical protein